MDFNVSRDPILKPLNTIECRHALLDLDGREAEWPDADVRSLEPQGRIRIRARRCYVNVQAERTGSIGSGREPLAGMGVKCRPVVTAMTCLARRHISLLGGLAR